MSKSAVAVPHISGRRETKEGKEAIKECAKWNGVDWMNEQRVGKQPEALIDRESSNSKSFLREKE